MMTNGWKIFRQGERSGIQFWIYNEKDKYLFNYLFIATVFRDDKKYESNKSPETANFACE